MGDVTQEGVLQAARIHRAHALLSLTSHDTTILEAALYARSVKPDPRAALRLYDDLATAVHRTLRAEMRGRQILSAAPAGCSSSPP